jgi:hypothetical protein
MLNTVTNAKLQLGALISLVVIFIVWSVYSRPAPSASDLDTSSPDPQGTPRMRIGQARNVMEQPRRDNSLDELLKRE